MATTIAGTCGHELCLGCASNTKVPVVPYRRRCCWWPAPGRWWCCWRWRRGMCVILVCRRDSWYLVVGGGWRWARPRHNSWTQVPAITMTFFSIRSSRVVHCCCHCISFFEWISEWDPLLLTASNLVGNERYTICSFINLSIYTNKIRYTWFSQHPASSFSVFWLC